MSIPRWQILLSVLEKEERLGWIDKDICDEERLIAYESKFGIKLPKAYKDFCQVFGTVSFGSYVQVYCPDSIASKDLIASASMELELQTSNDTRIGFQRIRALLDSALVFGLTHEGDYILWDLRTYSESDSNYDIYLVPNNGIEDVYFICRDLFEFICDFCLSDKPFEILPYYRYPSPQDLRHTYTTFSNKNELGSDSTTQESFCIEELDLDFLVDEKFYYSKLSHLHLPRNVEYSEPEPLNPNLEDQVFEAMRRELENRNPYAFFRYIRTLGKHNGAVFSIVFHPDGRTLASGSADTTIKLWDLETGEELHTLTGHTQSVLSVAISPDGRTLASGSADTTIKLWDLETGEELHTLTGHTQSVLSVAISPDGRTLASGSADTTIKLWDLETGEELHTLTGHTQSVLSVAISPDGRTLASGSADTTIKLWDLETGEGRSALFAHSGFVFAVYFHSNGVALVSAHSGTEVERTIRIWSLDTQVYRSFRVYDEVIAISVAPSGKAIVGAGGRDVSEYAISFYDFDTNDTLATFESGFDISTSHKDIVYSVAFNFHGHMLASGSKDFTIKLWGVPESVRAKMEKRDLASRRVL